MKKRLNPIIASVIALVCVSVICVGLLAVANKLLALTDEDIQKRETAFLKSVLAAESYELEYSQERNQSKDKKLNDFNDDYGSSSNYVARVFIAGEGSFKGQYIIESASKGYNGEIRVLIAYNKDGTIKSVSINDSPKAELIKKLDTDNLSDMLFGKSGDVGDGNKYKGKIKDNLAGTGATTTLNAMLRAINLANTFYESVIIGKVETPQIKSDSTTISFINGLFALTEGENRNKTFDEYIYYPIRLKGSKTLTSSQNTVSSAEIKEVYVLETDHIVLKIESGSGYDFWRIYVLMDSNGLIDSIVFDSNNIEVEGPYDASNLANNITLTALFKGKSKSDIDQMQKYLGTSTNVTETNNGIKVAAYCAIEQFDNAKTRIEEMNTEFAPF